MNRFYVVLISGVAFLSSCNIESIGTGEMATQSNETPSTSTASESSSTTPISSTTFSYSAPTEEKSSALTKWLADTLPELTKEEICKKDTLVPSELWKGIDGWQMYEPGAYREHYSMREVLEKQFHKQLEEVTYGELWRYNNAGEEWNIWPGSLDDNSDEQFPTIFKEFRSISDILFNPSVVSRRDDWSNLAAMTWLKKLKIWGGNVSMLFDLPAEIKSLVNLEVLDLRYNRLKKLPDIFDSFPKLEYLNLDYNEITELPPSTYRLKNLKYLYLSNLNFDVVPANISQLQSLEYLNLGSQLHNIPDEICELKSLKYLEFGQLGRRSVYDEYASSDEPGLVTSLPENIGDLNNLEVLRINNLPIKTLPSSFSKLKNLKRLIILGVPLEALPEDIEHLTSLEEINLGGAPLKVVPDNLKELPKLRIIHL